MGSSELVCQATWPTSDLLAALIGCIEEPPLQDVTYEHHTACRRAVNFGGVFDFDTLELKPALD